MTLSKEELKFMSDLIGTKNGKLDPAESFTLDHANWLNRYADLGFWKFGLNIQGGWLTEEGRDWMINTLWENECPVSNRMEHRLSFEMIEEMEKGFL